MIPYMQQIISWPYQASHKVIAGPKMASNTYIKKNLVNEVIIASRFGLAITIWLAR